jgi:Protein of unknown function (DUF2023)
MAAHDPLSSRVPAPLPHCRFELRRGVCNSCLLTMNVDEARVAQVRIRQHILACFIQPDTEDKLGVYFGRRCYVDVARTLDAF